MDMFCQLRKRCFFINTKMITYQVSCLGMTGMTRVMPVILYGSLLMAEQNFDLSVFV